MVNRDALTKKRRTVGRDGSGQDTDLDEYLEQEARDNQWRDEWAAHGRPNGQGLYDIGWYADRIEPPQTANTVNLGGNERPIGHMKHFTSGTMVGGPAHVEKGERVPEASRGVGQESLDGFMEKNPKSVWTSLPDETKMQVLASYIKGNIMNQALWTAAKTVGALGIPTR